jgi:hypothetical protein
MQAVAIVTGDEFLVSYNITIDTKNVERHINNLVWNWQTDQPHGIGFDDLYGVRFAKILGSSGFCFTFNIVPPDKIFYLER